MVTFWMVFVEGGGNPTAKHQTLEVAEAEAERLVKQHGKKAFVLQAIKACRPAERPVEWDLPA